MKKILTILFVLTAIPLVFTACDDDNDLPDVDITVNFENAVRTDDGRIYIVKGNPVSITSIEVTNREAGKKAFATAAIYYLDGLRIGASVISPFAFSFATDNLPADTYDLNIEVEIIAVDKAPAFGVLGYEICIVDDESEIPGNQPPESNVSVTDRPGLHSK